MIHKITISNFFCIADEVVLDLRMAKNAPKLPRFLASNAREDIRIPSVVALFGPNASGKSTLLRALTATVSFVKDSFHWTVDSNILGFQPFMSEDMRSKETKISFEFEANWLSNNETDGAELFRYELRLNNPEDLSISRSVSYEALFHAPQDRKRLSWRRLFEREVGKKLYTSADFKLGGADSVRDQVRPNASVIGTLAQHNNELALRIHKDLSLTQSNLWGSNRTSFNLHNVLSFYQVNPETLESLNREIRRFDVGIDSMYISSGPSGLFAMFHHKGLSLPINFVEESSGTQNFVVLFAILDFALRTGHIAILDEFDNDLHALLIPELLRWFQDPERNRYKAQLFFTAHNTSILEHLEKEEVFFAEKDENGATKAYGAQDIQGLRRDVDIGRKYLGGVLGAVPRFG